MSDLRWKHYAHVPPVPHLDFESEHHVNYAIKFISRRNSYPEINVQIAGALEFSVAYLERHRHLVIFVEILPEAFTPMRLKLNAMRNYTAEQAAQREETRCR
jgi:hypothetical protein